MSASPRDPSHGTGSTPLLPYPSCFRSNSPWLNSNKIMSELHRKSEIISWKRNVLSFISYTSTCLPQNTCLGSLAVLLIDFCDMMTWGCTSFKFKVLEVFISKTQNKATLVLSLPYTYSRAFTSFTYKFKPIAVFPILSSCKRYASEVSYDCSSLWVVHVHSHHTKVLYVLHKALHPPEIIRKETHERHSC